MSITKEDAASSELQDNDQVLEYAIKNDPNIKVAIDKLVEGVDCLNLFVTEMKNESSSSLMKFTSDKVLRAINHAQIKCRMSCENCEDDTYQLCKDRQIIENEISKQKAILQGTSKQIEIKENERANKRMDLERAKSQLSEIECTVHSAKNKHEETKALALLSTGVTAVASVGAMLLSGGTALPIVAVAQSFVGGSSIGAFKASKDQYEQVKSNCYIRKCAFEMTESDLKNLERKIESLSKDLKNSEEKQRRIVEKYEGTMKSLRSMTKLLEYLQEWQFSIQNLFSSVEVLDGTEIQERLKRQLNMLVVDIDKKLNFISKTGIMKNNHSLRWNGNELEAKLQIRNNLDSLTDESDAYL